MIIFGDTLRFWPSLVYHISNDVVNMTFHGLLRFTTYNHDSPYVHPHISWSLDAPMAKPLINSLTFSLHGDQWDVKTCPTCPQKMGGSFRVFNNTTNALNDSPLLYHAVITKMTPRSINSLTCSVHAPIETSKHVQHVPKTGGSFRIFNKTTNAWSGSPVILTTTSQSF